MNLTRFSDYSLRVLIYLGVNQRRLSTISEIASAYAISENHLMKVVHNLGQLGFIETIRGKGGGMRLARAPELLNIGDILRYTEGDSALLPCVEGQGDCCILPVCKLTAVLREVQTAIFEVFDRYTLADLIIQQSALTRLLDIS